MGCVPSRTSQAEVFDYIDGHANLWALLSVNLALNEEDCKQIALRIIIDIGTQGKGLSSKDKDGKLEFRSAEWKRAKAHLCDSRGSLDFFHRTVFAAFDEDKNSVLDKGELDNFLKVYYEGHSIFANDARLPPRDELREIIYTELDKNNDGYLQYEELRPLIEGKIRFGHINN